MNNYAKVIGAAVAVIAVGALGLALLRGGTPPAAANVASPAPSPAALASSPAQPSQSLPPAASVNRASSFLTPFTYSLPIDPKFDFGAMTERYFEVRVPEWADAGHPGGLIVQAIGAGRADPCDAASAPLQLERGPEAVFNYLASIPALTITEAKATTVGGAPAIQATVMATETDGCPELHVWTEEGEPFITGPTLRLIAVDVEGHHVVVTVFGEPSVPEWPALADFIIESINWGYAIPSPTPWNPG